MKIYFLATLEINLGRAPPPLTNSWIRAWSLESQVKNECACVDIDQNGKQTPMNIATMEIGDSSIGDIQFYHKFQQETFTALYVSQKIIETGKNIMQIIDESLKESDYDIRGFFQRYAFVVLLNK